jgi:hypothetical protein
MHRNEIGAGKPEPGNRGNSNEVGSWEKVRIGQFWLSNTIIWETGVGGLAHRNRYGSQRKPDCMPFP